MIFVLCKRLQTTKFSPEGDFFVEIHGPSIGIGAGIASVVIVAAFFAFNNLFDEPELVLEPLDDFEADPKPLTLVVFTSNGSPYFGDPSAPITLVEFGDYQCFFCNKFFHETEPTLFKDYVETGKVKVIFKDYTIIGPDSLIAANAAHCADDQGKFWNYHDILYSNWTGENNGWAASENLFRFANELELDMEKFSVCMTELRHQVIIEGSNQDAKTLGLTGTPGFFVIGPDNKITKISGAQPYAVFQQIFDSELQK